MRSDDCNQTLTTGSFAPRTIHGLSIVSLTILALTVLADFIFTPKDHFGIDGTVGFYAWFGCASAWCWYLARVCSARS